MDTNVANAGPGHNNPPEPIEIFRAELRETHASLLKIGTDLLGMAERLPATMDDDWEKKLSDAVKKCHTFWLEADAQRKAAARPLREQIAAIDGLFHGVMGPIEKLKTTMSSDYLTPYKDAKEAAEKRRREEVARLAAEKAAEERRRAQEEERLKREARVREEAAKRESERIKREAAEAKERREREERESRERAERDRIAAEERRIAAERAAVEAEGKRKRAAAERAAADARRQQEELERQESDRQARARETERAQREKERADKIEAERLEREAKERRREQDKAAAEARDVAAAAERAKDKTGRAAQVNAAELSRSRSDLGAVSSLRTTWTHEVEEPSRVPREYLAVDDGAIDRAIKAATHNGKCDLKIKGVRIFPVRDTVTR